MIGYVQRYRLNQQKTDPLIFSQTSSERIVLSTNRNHSNLSVGALFDLSAVGLQLLGDFTVHCPPLHPTGLDVGAVLNSLYCPLIKGGALVVLEPSGLISRNIKFAVQLSQRCPSSFSVVHGRTRHSGIHYLILFLCGVREVQMGHDVLGQSLLADRIQQRVFTASLTSARRLKPIDPLRK